MCSSKIIYVIFCYVEGEVGDVIVGGVILFLGEMFWD